MFKALPQNSSVVSIRSISVEAIDKSFAWGYFDGSAAGEPKLCGTGGMMFLSKVHFFSFKDGLGLGTNNFAELRALKLLLYLARRNLVVKFQAFGDSQLAINWASGKYHLRILELAMILLDVHRITDSFDSVVFKNIYRERNTAADVLAKDGGRILEGFGQLWNIVLMKLWKPFRFSKLIVSMGHGGVLIVWY